MEWLWLLLSVAGLGLLWLLIIGMEKLAERLKVHDEERRLDRERIAKRTAAAESALLKKQSDKDDAKDYIENADLGDQDDLVNAELLRDAIQTLTPDELVQSVAKRMFGTPEGTDSITANQSAFDQVQPQKVVARGGGVTPVKTKPSSKSALSKSEQKLLKKIKQGD